MKLTHWYIKFLLFFCKIECRTTHDRMGADYNIIFKRLFNKVYIIDIVQIPPKHFNCRCQILPLGVTK